MKRRNVLKRRDKSLHSILKDYEKNLMHHLPYIELPLEICEGTNIDLSKWTLVVSDKCLVRVAETIRNRCTVKLNSNNSVKNINFSGGDKITDQGLREIARVIPNISKVVLDNLFNITEHGLTFFVRSCHQIIHFSLSGCFGISENGFAIIGQHCSKLRVLQLSGCRQISTWALMKIFEGCRLLEEVDVSYCIHITDQEIQFISDYCKSLSKLNLKDCRQISDVGLLSLAKGCKSLTLLNLSRSELVEKVTDISLLVLGEESKRLECIDLSGCEMITDAGLSWLTKGCKNLQKINLSNCNKVTNGGMRYLGEECHQLKNISIANLKKVSDVGIRYIADGCHSLEDFNVSGLYMLSDGANRDFGFEGLQALARSPCARTLKKFNSHGCFQFKTIALNSISSFCNLEVLILSGCTEIGTENMIEIAKKCVILKVLSLAGCGDCITNNMLESMGQFMRSIEHLTLTECRKIGRKGLKGLSLCTKLSHLDLSGCVGVTNDAVLCLCGGNFYPGLRVLRLEKCPKISDHSLNWICDGLQDPNGAAVGESSLLILAVKGTKITLPALNAIQERLRFSKIKNCESYFGFWPQSRAADRKVMFQYKRMSDLAARIQSLFRAQRDRAIADLLREERRKILATILVASIWRGSQARKNAKEMRQIKWLKRAMTLKLQCWFRTIVAKRSLFIRKQKRWLLVSVYAATRIQCILRGRRGRKLAHSKHLNHIANLKKREDACIKVQSIFRVVFALNIFNEKRHDKLMLEKLKIYSSIKIQQRWRIIKAKNILYKKRLIHNARKLLEFESAKIIFIACRKYQLRQNIKSKVLKTRYLHQKATCIQLWFKDLQRKIKDKKLKKKMELQRRENASVLIESAWRRKDAYIKKSVLVKQKQEIENLKYKKGFVLTSWWRVCLARHRVWRLRLERLEEERCIMKWTIWAATTIAAAWRGKMGRDKMKEAFIAKQSRWKQLWSEEENRYFFYNQFTGETRWRKPQPLLDLVQRPICSNCSYYEAQFECSDCCEYFCTQCWETVHYGGKRAKHSFRALYDYYGKRIDYFDYDGTIGEYFPSRWPSEIEQDDQLGWKILDNHNNCDNYDTTRKYQA